MNLDMKFDCDLHLKQPELLQHKDFRSATKQRVRIYQENYSVLERLGVSFRDLGNQMNVGDDDTTTTATTRRR